jgi:RHS repeat-associated protein
MSGCAEGQFRYAPLASPVTLSANTDYLVVSYEVGADKFHDWTGTALTTTSVAAVKHGVYTTDGGQTWGPAGWPGNSYVPLDFQYQTVVGATADVRWLVSDQLGTPRMVLDQTGSLSGVTRRDYFPFGEEIGAGIGGRMPAQGYSGPERLRHGFTGHEKDGETRLNFAQSRYHSPAQGRFTSPDRPFADQVAGDPQSWNLYSYVRNNPLTYTDPLGLWRRLHHNSGEFWEAEEGDTLSDLAGILGVSTSSLVRFYGSSRVGIGQIFDVGNYREYQEAQDLSEISAQQELQERKVVQYYVERRPCAQGDGDGAACGRAATVFTQGRAQTRQHGLDDGLPLHKSRQRLDAVRRHHQQPHAPGAPTPQE